MLDVSKRMSPLKKKERKNFEKYSVLNKRLDLIGEQNAIFFFIGSLLGNKKEREKERSSEAILR